MTALFVPQIRLYQDWLRTQRGLVFDDYDALWRWSVTDLDAFWQSVWDYFEIASPTPHRAVLAANRMPGAQWFPGAQVNYLHQVLRHVEPAHAAGMPAIVACNERGQRRELGWPELRRQVAALALHLRAQGVQPGDRVAAYLPNIPEAMVAFLATVGIGAVWSICAPDMGTHAVLDRFRQIEPTVLIGVDGVTYGGRDMDRCAVLQELRAQLPSVRHVLLVNDLDATKTIADGALFTDVVARNDAEVAAFEPLWLPFDHPLWIVYSSGTTGLPKPIVHGHGGIVLESLKMGALHNNVGASVETGDRYHWYSSTGWIMWNTQPGALLGGTTVCTFDGNPGGRIASPDLNTIWQFAADAGATFFGAGAAFYANCLKAGIQPAKVADLSKLRAIGSTGSPLAADGYRWVWEQMPKVDGQRIWLTPIAGGTDFAGAFVGGLITLPVVEGEMQVRCLGAAVEAWSEADASGRGRSLVDEVGELVCVKPMPSMPLRFWNDAGNKRYLDSYFDMYPGVWRHGDWIRITPRGGAIIYGRSDATINRHGIRMGTAELYRAVEAQPEVIDSLVVDLEYLGRESYMPLFVVLREGLTLDEALVKRLKQAIKEALSARHVPNEIFQVSAIPRTLSGKKMELPVKKLLLGTPAEQVFKLDAMANADCVPWFVAFAAKRVTSPS